MTEATAKTAGDNSKNRLPIELKIIENPTPMIKTALIVRCLISVGLKPSLVRGRRGVYVNLYSKGGDASLGALVFSICVQAWFSGNLCSAQKSP